MILKDTGRNFTPAPAGLHQAVCVDVVELGQLDTQWGKKEKLEIRWQSDVRMDAGERFMISSRYTASLNEKATLRQHLESWRGRAFTPEELRGFDTENLIGANCQIQVVHVPGTKDPSKMFARVQAIVPLGKSMEKMKPEDYVRAKDRITPEAHDEQAAEPEEEVAPF